MRTPQRVSDLDTLREEYRVNESEQKFADTFFQVFGYDPDETDYGLRLCRPIC